jgi:hypothetical protein
MFFLIKTLWGKSGDFNKFPFYMWSKEAELSEIITQHHKN